MTFCCLSIAPPPPPPGGCKNRPNFFRVKKLTKNNKLFKHRKTCKQLEQPIPIFDYHLCQMILRYTVISLDYNYSLVQNFRFFF